MMLDVARQKKARERDGTLVRHLHDLAALEPRITAAPDFAAEVHALMKMDMVRARAADEALASIIAEVRASLETDPVWRKEYNSFIRHLSYAADDERIAYDAALACWIRLTQPILDATHAD
jgi:hypothetical protein